MRNFLLGLVIVAAGLNGAGPGRAAVPDVVTDIAPVHALVSQVMGDLGQPDLLVGPGYLPHDYRLRPSQARALQEARVVFWVGPALTPWLAGALDALSPSAKQVILSQAPGNTQRPMRPGGAFGIPDTAGDTVGQAGAGAEYDPHLWLDPANASVWLGVIADQLAVVDPENAAAYRANAAAAKAELAQLTAEVATRLAPVRDVPYLVYHDAFQHFEKAFGVNAIGAISGGDAAAPGLKRMVEMRDLAAAQKARCLFTEPQINAERLVQVFGAQKITQATLDPLGADLTPGTGLYPALILQIADRMAACLSPLSK